MDERAMKYIVAISKHQNLTKAAEALYVGQPTLSKFLAEIETRLGLKLFRRVGHRYVPTYAGERYIEHSREILRMIDSLNAELADIQKQNTGTVNITFANMRCSYMLPVLLPAFRNIYPNVKVNIFEGSSDENDRRLLDGLIELAFYTMPSEPDPRIEYIPLAQEELLICAPHGHPLRECAQANPGGRYPSMDLKRVQSELVLMMQPSQRTRQIVDSILRENGIRLENVLYTSNIHAIMGLVSAGYGISFVFDSHLKHRADSAPVDCYSIGNPGTVYDFVAAKRRGSYLSRYAADFIETVRHFV